MTLTGASAAALSALAWSWAAAPPPGRPPQPAALLQTVIRGKVVAAGTRTPIAGASVFVVPDDSGHRPGRALPSHQHHDPDDKPAWIRSTTTDEGGAFEVQPKGRLVRVVVSAPGYARLEQVVDTTAHAHRTVPLFMQPDAETAYRTVVTAPPEPKPGRVTSRILTPAEIATLPGTQGDSLRALQNFPGVARPPGGLGMLVLRGAAPNQSQVFYGEHALPRAFHALAIASVVPAAAIESIDFMPGNAPARFGETTGGVVAMEPAHLDATAWHGYGEVDLAGGGAFASGPVGKGGLLVAANRGWVDGALRMVELISPASSYTMPRYSDYQALYARPIGRGARIEARALGATDRVQSRFYNQAAAEHQVVFEVQTQFHRADLVVSKRHGRWRFMVSPSVRVELNAVDRRENRTRRTDVITSWRAEASVQASRRVSLLLGTDTEVDPFRTRNERLDTNGDVVDELTRRSRGVQTRSGLYATADARIGRLTLSPSVRLNAFTLGSDAETATDPRLAGRWQLSDRWRWTFGVGIYSQSEVQQRVTETAFLERLGSLIAGGVVLPAAFETLEPRAGFDPVVDDVRVARAVQASAGLRWQPSDGWSLDAAAFGRVRGNTDGLTVVSTGSGPEVRASPDTYDVAYGLEFIARRAPVGKLYGWVSYTLSRNEVRFLDALNGSDKPQNGPFDQRHILALVASYALPKRWRIGGRFRLVSGSPFTDVVGVVELLDTADQALVAGEPNAARFPVFHQLDLRVDKVWVNKRVIVTTYLDVQNVYNRTNIEAYIYDSAFRERFNGVGLPIFPSLGVRVDF